MSTFGCTLQDANSLSFDVNDHVPPKITAYFTPHTNYKGEFGFDWCLWNTDNGEITKFQNVETSNIEYVFNETNNQFEAASSANKEMQQEFLKNIYTEKTEVIKTKKPYYTPWLMLLKGKMAQLTLNVDVFEEGEGKAERFVLIEKHNDYDVEYKVNNHESQINEDIKIPITKSDDFTISITALKDTTNNTFLKVTTEDKQPIAFIELAANKTDTLSIKLIPVIFKNNNETESVCEQTAKDNIYSKAKGAKGTNAGTDLNDYLSNYAFNQAAIKCEVQEFKEYLAIDVNDHYSLWYKFYKNGQIQDWELSEDESKLATICFTDRNEVLKQKEESLHAAQNAFNSDPKNKVLKTQLKIAQKDFDTYKNAPFRPDPWLNEDGNYYYQDADPNKPTCLQHKKVLLLNSLETAYKAKYGNSFKGALVFVTNKEFASNTLGYSEVVPLRNQGVLIGNGILTNAPAYAHELGHMLGLHHVFFKDEKEVKDVNKTIESLNNSIDEIEEKQIEPANININELQVVIEKKKKYATELGFSDKETEEYIADQNTDLNKNKAEKEASLQIQDYYRSRIETEIINQIRVKKSITDNYMDYYSTMFSFSKLQALTMKNELNEYYK